MVNNKTPPKEVPKQESENVATDPPEKGIMMVRWPFGLPSGDIREIQIAEITPDNPFYPYKMLPGAGMIYGLDVSIRRINYLTDVIRGYLPLLCNFSDSIVNLTQWPTSAMQDGTGFGILQFEYENFRPGKEKKNKKLTASQLIFGFDEPDYDWIKDELNLKTGRLKELTLFKSSHYAWLGQREDGWCREYRMNERWVWNSCYSDYQKEEQERESANKFFEYAISKGEFVEEWKQLQKTAIPTVLSLFCVFATNPKRGMQLFGDFNFRHPRKWHRYKPLERHAALELGSLCSVRVGNFEDDVDIHWQSQMETVQKGYNSLNEYEKSTMVFAGDPKYVQAMEITRAVNTMEKYTEFKKYCQKKKIDPNNLKVVKELPVYQNFEKYARSFVPTSKDGRKLHLETYEDAYILFTKITAFSKSLCHTDVKVTDELQSLFAENDMLFNCFVNGANAYEYRRNVSNGTNKQMFTKYLFSCLNTTTKFSSFEETMASIVISPNLTTGQVVEAFQESLQMMEQNPQIDPTISAKEIQRKVNKIIVRLHQIFINIKKETLELGLTDFENIVVSEP